MAVITWSFLILSVLLTLMAAPAVSSASCTVCSKTYLANFNDIATSPGGSPVVTQNPPPTPYDGLAYENFTVVAQAPVPAVLDHSPPNHGSATTINALAHAGQALRANYAGSHVAAFDLHDFWFGCKLLTVQQPNGGPAQACTVQVTGYKQDPLHPSVCDTAGPATFAFNPGALTLFYVPMVHAVLDATFSGLTNITIAITNSEVNNKLTILYTDDFNYTTHGVCCP